MFDSVEADGGGCDLGHIADGGEVGRFVKDEQEGRIERSRLAARSQAPVVSVWAPPWSLRASGIYPGGIAVAAWRGSVRRVESSGFRAVAASTEQGGSLAPLARARPTAPFLAQRPSGDWYAVLKRRTSTRLQWILTRS